MSWECREGVGGEIFAFVYLLRGFYDGAIEWVIGELVLLGELGCSFDGLMIGEVFEGGRG